MLPSYVPLTAVEREQLVEFRRRLHARADELYEAVDAINHSVDRGVFLEVDARDEVAVHERELASILDTLDRLADMFPTYRGLAA